MEGRRLGALLLVGLSDYGIKSKGQRRTLYEDILEKMGRSIR
jgi:hypothetical protein